MYNYRSAQPLKNLRIYLFCHEFENSVSDEIMWYIPMGNHNAAGKSASVTHLFSKISSCIRAALTSILMAWAKQCTHNCGYSIDDFQYPSYYLTFCNFTVQSPHTCVNWQLIPMGGKIYHP
jgi:hypothetical protein